jgi:catechol 2,3-dioxygenase
MSFHHPPCTFVCEVHLKIRSLDQSVQFYKDIIGLQVLNRSKKMASLTADGERPLVVLEEIDHAETNTGRKTGLYHIALLLPNRTELANYLYHLLETRYPLQGASDHLVSEAIYLADPDGNGIEIYADRPEDTWKKVDGTIEMATNPINGQELLAQKNKEKFVALPPETIMGHIHLQVSNINEAEEFYRALGFNVVNRYGRQAIFVSTGGYHHHIGLNTWQSSGAPAPSPNEVGLKTFTIKFPNEESRNTTVERLRRVGAEVTHKENHIVTLDPSQNVILLVV